MRNKEKVWATTLIALWWLAPNQTNAQQDSIKSVNLNEVVVVTATKFPKNQNETGKVLTVIDEQQLSRSSGKDLAQLLNEQVGIVINGANSNPGKDKSVFVRGATSEHTLILLDGIPVNDPSGVGGAFDLRLLPIDQIERVEILKGSQSTLYGSDAIAGVINIITKKKGTKPLGGSGTLSYGSYNTFKGNAGINGSTKLVDYNIGYTRFKTDGISEATDEKGTGNFDKDGYAQNAFQANLGIRPTDKLIVKPFVRYTDFDGKYDAGSFKDDLAGSFRSKLINYGLTSQYDFSNGAVNIQYGRDRVERRYISTDEYSASGYDTIPFSGNFDNAEVFANYSFTKQLQILGGLNHQWTDMDNPHGIIKDPSVKITSPYLSFFLKDMGGFSLELGGRYVNHSTFGSTLTYSINPSYFINRSIKLFANYSTGFKAPTLSQLYGQYGSNKNLKVEQSKSSELGVQFFLPDNKFNVRVTGFSRNVDNSITYNYATGYINLDKQADYGFEIEPNTQITSKLNIRAFYAFVDGKVTTKVADRDTTYNNLIRRPKNSFGVNVGYQVTNKLFASLNFKTFGKRDDKFFDSNTFTTKDVSLDAYQLVDVYIEYRLLKNKLKLFIDAKNLLNQKYYEVYGYNTQRFNLNTGVSFNL